MGLGRVPLGALLNRGLKTQLTSWLLRTQQYKIRCSREVANLQKMYSRDSGRLIDSRFSRQPSVKFLQQVGLDNTSERLHSIRAGTVERVFASLADSVYLLHLTMQLRDAL